MTSPVGAWAGTLGVGRQAGEEEAGDEAGDIEDEELGSDDWIDFVRDSFYPVTTIELPFSCGYEPVGDNLRVIE